SVTRTRRDNKTSKNKLNVPSTASQQLQRQCIPKSQKGKQRPPKLRTKRADKECQISLNPVRKDKTIGKENRVIQPISNHELGQSQEKQEDFNLPLESQDEHYSPEEDFNYPTRGQRFRNYSIKVSVVSLVLRSVRRISFQIGAAESLVTAFTTAKAKEPIAARPILHRIGSWNTSPKANKTLEPPDQSAHEKSAKHHLPSTHWWKQ
ncbi:hypothetical protein L9F63_010589, partial [Diploptera punctata]